jgi:predicted DNA-binding transcriptional regulator AlpA
MERDAFNIIEFCQRHNLSRSAFYELQRIGQAPRIMRVGSRRMISREAAADWRREREAVPAAGGKAS